MAHNVSEFIIDSLADVKIPHYVPLAQASDNIGLNDTILPEHRCNTLTLGSGAARWRAATELRRQNIDVMVVPNEAFWGTSVCSGSDKQTPHTVNTRASGDHFLTLSNTLATGGVMDHDTVYVEAVGSVNTCKVLKYLGLDLPEDLFGVTLRYQTSHDKFDRAASCGPWTSRLMVEVLAQEVMRLNTPLCDHVMAICIPTSGGGENRRVEGVIAIDKACRDNPWRMIVTCCQHLILATGGPGKLCRDSAYLVNCFNVLGMALEIGIILVNLTGSQFGISTPRNQSPWNLSGTYIQAIPRICSQDHSGRQYNLLAAYCSTTRMLASAVFRKGHQWPFHVEWVLEYGSDLLDVAAYEGTQEGRDVFPDFLWEPEPAADGTLFNLRELDDDVADYLQQDHALLTQPLAGLTQMNLLAIRLYQMYGHDLTTSPLKFTLDNQHLNGGTEVDIWARTSLTGYCAAGGNAGAHDVMRPGGVALNARQVFVRRCALHTAHQESQDRPLRRQQIPSTISKTQ